MNSRRRIGAFICIIFTAVDSHLAIEVIVLHTELLLKVKNPFERKSRFLYKLGMDKNAILGNIPGFHGT